MHRQHNSDNRLLSSRPQWLFKLVALQSLCLLVTALAVAVTLTRTPPAAGLEVDATAAE